MRDDDNPSLEASLDDLKEIYRALTRHLDEHPELDDNAFYQSLHRLLQAQATVEGVDVSDDAEWHTWLESTDAPASSERPSNLLN